MPCDDRSGVVPDCLEVRDMHDPEPKKPGEEIEEDDPWLDLGDPGA